jgi:hypothetical protein
VLRSGDRVSITAQLLDPATGAQLWTNRYERDLQDVLVLRSEIVSAIVREIKMQLSPTEEARLASAPGEHGGLRGISQGTLPLAEADER